MFIKHVNHGHPNRHHELFQPCRAYRGEPPTVAGFLLYPETPTKMETTSREAFCFRPVPQRHKEDLVAHSSLESCCSTSTSLRQTDGGNRERVVDEDEGSHAPTELTVVNKEDDATEMLSQYQNDFPPPSSCRRRRTPALPQPDNIGINPAFRIELSTVQREAYPGWPILNPKYTNRLRVASSSRPKASE
ncbi:uncharacterized protein si:dkeyp-69c1.9 isoform X1 [Antennarius striatus]|uniref:uncharacterized protein si:dkeyp-69c1.9 isoform X1 n=1 Tax=Antennarius striatus TaxID=241820 RepID=UPI0035B4E79D